MSLFSIIGVPLGWVMHLIYQFVQNYGITLILFTILIRVLFIPLAIKQQKGMITTAKFKPKMDELQRKYGNNKERLNQEIMELYKQENYSPLSSCLPTLLQFPLLFGLIDVIYYPLKHMLRLPADVAAKATEIATEVLGAAGMSRYSSQISVINAVKSNPEPFIAGIGADMTNQIRNFDFSFFGLNLGNTPTLMPAEGQDFGVYFVLLLIPILSGITSLLLSHITSSSNKGMMGDQATNSMTTSMMLMMPLMSVYIAFQVPAGVGVYWLMTNCIMIAQTMLLNRFMNPAKIAAEAKAEAEVARERERVERIEAKKKAKEERENGTAEETLSQKEINRQKLAAARKRDAEKYGEEYKEVTDSDLK